jgi:hypothetical protein
MKDIINSTCVATYVLESAIGKVQDMVLKIDGCGEVVDPNYALKELQDGLDRAAKLARELSPRNFQPGEIVSQRTEIEREAREL